jgi:hypothetical protein
MRVFTTLKPMNKINNGPNATPMRLHKDSGRSPNKRYRFRSPDKTPQHASAQQSVLLRGSEKKSHKLVEKPPTYPPSLTNLDPDKDDGDDSPETSSGASILY